jgi:WD40 repeat protein
MVHTSAVTCLAFSYDDQLLASGDMAGTIQVWKVRDGKCLRKFDVQLSKEIAAVTRIVINP